MTSKNRFFKVALPSLPPLPQGFGGLRRSPRSLGVGAFTPQGVARHAGLIRNVDVPRPGSCAVWRGGSMEGLVRRINFKCAGHVVFINIYNRSVIKTLKMYIYTPIVTCHNH